MNSIERAEKLDKKKVIIFGMMHLLALLGIIGAFFTNKMPPNLAIWFVAGFFLTGCLGISVGYHRLLAHKSFVTKRWVENILILLGSTAFQTGPVTWMKLHLSHHKHSDRAGDPHSRSRGFWWSHMLWALHKAPNGFRAREFSNIRPTNPFVLFLERRFQSVNLTIAIGFLIFLDPITWIWAFPIRIVTVWHLTWLVNSYAHHPAGTRSNDSSRNRLILSFFTFGEGLHSNHHSSPRGARFGNAWEGDLGYLFISLLAVLRLATQIVPSSHRT